MADVAPDTHQTLLGISVGDLDILESAIGLRELSRESTGLDARTFALVKIAALIALDAPPASYAWQIGNALDDGQSRGHLGRPARRGPTGRRPQGHRSGPRDHSRPGPHTPRRVGDQLCH